MKHGAKVIGSALFVATRGAPSLYCVSTCFTGPATVRRRLDDANGAWVTDWAPFPHYLKKREGTAVNLLNSVPCLDAAELRSKALNLLQPAAPPTARTLAGKSRCREPALPRFHDRHQRHTIVHWNSALERRHRVQGCENMTAGTHETSRKPFYDKARSYAYPTLCWRAGTEISSDA